MNTTFTIDGMHCQACVSLIRMELEDNGFEDKVVSLELKDDNKGELVLEGIEENDVQIVSDLIN
ncbi:MAG: heavy metal-associated domain-containing protein [Candidatus Dojkabacteria bacterium]|nr:heavy metal-associated domain-containing protein [Candidatus Dojkabacteria bacterium]MDQ7021205.1 heavy metal-associated domain-containing protein [Candidatus Dojkabacteria bacterium]